MIGGRNMVLMPCLQCPVRDCHIIGTLPMIRLWNLPAFLCGWQHGADFRAMLMNEARLMLVLEA